MHKITHKQKFVALNHPEKLVVQSGTKSLFDFVKQSITTIGQKSSVAFVKLQEKLSETPSVFVLPMQSRKKSQHETKITMQKESGSIRLQQQVLSKEKSKSHLSQKQEQRIRELMRRKQELMGRLKKIDHQLHNPYGVLSSQPNNDSFISMEYEKGQMLRPVESRINFKQNNAYNVMQHEKTMEMLSRLNNEKMRRQQKLVNELRKKQEIEIRNLEKIQKNKSQFFNERQSRPLTNLKSPYKKYSEKQTELDQDTIQMREMSQNTQVEEVKNIVMDNEFDVVEDIQIGNENVRTPTQQSAGNMVGGTD